MTTSRNEQHKQMKRSLRQSSSRSTRSSKGDINIRPTPKNLNEILKNNRDNIYNIYEKPLSTDKNIKSIKNPTQGQTGWKMQMTGKLTGSGKIEVPLGKVRVHYIDGNWVPSHKLRLSLKKGSSVNRPNPYKGKVAPVGKETKLGGSYTAKSGKLGAATIKAQQTLSNKHGIPTFDIKGKISTLPNGPVDTSVKVGTGKYTQKQYNTIIAKHNAKYNKGSGIKIDSDGTKLWKDPKTGGYRKMPPGKKGPFMPSYISEGSKTTTKTKSKTYALNPGPNQRGSPGYVDPDPSEHLSVPRPTGQARNTYYDPRRFSVTKLRELIKQTRKTNPQGAKNLQKILSEKMKSSGRTNKSTKSRSAGGFKPIKSSTRQKRAGSSSIFRGSNVFDLANQGKKGKRGLFTDYSDLGGSFQ